MKLTKIRLLSLLFVIASVANPVVAQNNQNADTSSNMRIGDAKTKKSFRMTTLTFGGSGVNVTKVSNKLSVMTGGRGSATFNERFTIGGGGWGMTKGVEVESNTEGTYNFIKMGYGGIDFGYLFLYSDNFNLGSKLLVGGGAVFNETVPESDDKDFKMFPVLEPAVYYQVSLSKIFRFEMGTSYRYVMGKNPADKNLSGLSFYIGFLVKACPN